MSNPNPPTEHLKETQFKPGQSGNPGGKTSAQRQLEAENAERATRIRAKLLEALEARLSEDGADAEKDIRGEVLKLLKDSEDRGLGAPKQPVEHDVSDPLRDFFDQVRNSGKRVGYSQED